MSNRSRYLIMCLLLGLMAPLFGQRQVAERDTTHADRVTIDYTETLEVIQTKEGTIRKFMGSPERSVELSQDSIYMYCDSAVITHERTRVVAMGNVVIQQGDSVSVFADSLLYSGVTRIANLYGEVALQNGEQRLFTDSLHYDLNTKTATYTSKATLVNGDTYLTSKRGYYYVDTDEAYFKDSVVVTDPDFTLKADTLKMNTKTDVVTFLGPTLIRDDSTTIYTEAGYYDTHNELAEFNRRAQFVRGKQQARADTIRYNGAEASYWLVGNARFEEGARRAQADTIRYEERSDQTFLIGHAHYEDEEQEIDAPQIIYNAEKEVYSTRGRAYISDPPQILEADTVDYSDELGLGVASGDVIWRDTSSDLTIRSARAEYNRQTDYLKATGGVYGRPLLITLIDGDSLFMASDTLLAFREDTLSSDSSRILLAYYDVRIFKSDLQARCDSLTYSSRDSTFRFFKEPIIWSDTSQFIADTVRMQMRDDQIDKIYLINKGLIINSKDEVFFNQIKGKHITAHFNDNNLQRMDVIGNAESIYYALDDAGAYIGVNETVCSEMIIYWGDNEVETIRFLTQPTGTAHPMGKVNHNELRLENFRWVKEGRPGSVMDLFDLPLQPGKTAPDLSARNPEE